jgi:hypothetical protein
VQNKHPVVHFAPHHPNDRTDGMYVEPVATIYQAFFKLNAGRNEVVVDIGSAKYSFY